MSTGRYGRFELSLLWLMTSVTCMSGAISGIDGGVSIREVDVFRQPLSREHSRALSTCTKCSGLSNLFISSPSFGSLRSSLHPLTND